MQVRVYRKGGRGCMREEGEEEGANKRVKAKGTVCLTQNAESPGRM